MPLVCASEPVQIVSAIVASLLSEMIVTSHSHVVLMNN